GDKKSSGTLGFAGKKNRAISVDYHDLGEDAGYYSIRLPISRINLPALHIESGDHTVKIPASKSKISTLNDVDVKLSAFLKFGDKINYGVYPDALDIARMSVYGLEYHNAAKGIDVVFEKSIPL